MGRWPEVLNKNFVIVIYYLCTETSPVCSYFVDRGVFRHHDNMSMKGISPLTPLLHGKTGIYRGIPNFLIFDPQIGEAVVTCTHIVTINVLSEIIKIIKIFLMEFSGKKNIRKQLKLVWKVRKCQALYKNIGNLLFAI